MKTFSLLLHCRNITMSYLHTHTHSNMLLANSLSVYHSGTGVTTYALHPGVIQTELGRHFFPALSLWKRLLSMPFFFFLKTPWQGAQTTIYCAVDESLQNTSGLYYRSVASSIMCVECSLVRFCSSRPVRGVHKLSNVIITMANKI